MNDAIFDMQRLVLESIAAQRPTNDILDRLCELVGAIVPTGLATVMRLDERGILTFRNAPCVPPEAIEAFGELTPGPLSGSCGAAVHTKAMVLVGNTLTDPRWAGLRAVARDFTIRSCWSIPIFIEPGVIGGTFAVSRTDFGLPTDDERGLLEIAGYLAGIVLRLEQNARDVDEQKELLRAVVEGSQDPIFVKDLDGRYRLVNSAGAAHLGKVPDEVIGRTDEELFGQDEWPRSQATDHRLIRDGSSLVYEADFVSPADGQQHNYLIRKDPQRDADGRVIGIVGIARDLTEVRRVERALQQTQKLESLGVLAGGIAHDFNNLVTGILANVELLGQGAVSQADLSEGLSDIRRSARRAAELTNQLLEYAGKRQPARRALDLPAAVRELPQLLASSLSKKARLHFDFDPDLPVIEADPAQIRQVLMNLLINASEALGDATGDIGVRVRLLRDHLPSGHAAPGVALDRGEWLEIVVADSGCGMDRESVGRIFDPFFTTKFAGRGLGLASVQGIVASHGGCVDVASIVGQGTTFTLYLPARRVRDVPQPSTTTQDTSVRGGRILVIDDEDIVRRVTTRILQRSGFEVVAAVDGEQGLATFRQQKPQRPWTAVVLDLTMPGLDGRQVARSIRDRDARVPIVLTSGLAECDARQGIEPGWVDAFLSKPFTPNDVVDAVDTALMRRNARPVSRRDTR